MAKDGAVTPVESGEGESLARNRTFATTHWSVVEVPGCGESPLAADALEKLCHACW